MEAEQCLKTVFDEELSLEHRYRALNEYLSWWSRFGADHGIGRKLGRAEAASQLVKVASRQPNGKERLDALLRQFSALVKHLKESRNQQRQTQREKVARLAPGTPVVIRDELGQEQIVFFLELRRTKFICEFPDGRKVLAPLAALLRAAPDAAIQRLHPELSEQLGIVRALAGKQAFEAGVFLEQKGIAALPALLTELRNASKRIENAPVGGSNGLLRDSIGLVRRVSSVDEALVKRIPKTVVAIAFRHGVAEVLETVAGEASPEVRTVCYKALGRIPRGMVARWNLKSERDRLGSLSPELAALLDQLLAK